IVILSALHMKLLIIASKSASSNSDVLSTDSFHSVYFLESIATFDDNSRDMQLSYDAAFRLRGAHIRFV
ncbi:hypothetical protein, partial [Micromonospora sp. RP3T]|uniref:hypothetical protein n=1 Tax=Micromonospora sp. RP3T TaxID=2135446 RepID=UPI001E51217E